jgi:phosphomevalonate kinase
MAFVARAPGKLVILGEYAVLDGAPALVMAVNRYCRARIATSPDGNCHLTTRTPTEQHGDFEPSRPSGAQLVDLVAAAVPPGPAPPWSGELDSAQLYGENVKLGLGSSAAALVAWFGVWSAYVARHGGAAPEAEAGRLIALHRRFQGGSGSGLDVASCLVGGVISFRLERRDVHRVGSVRLPNGVGFAGIFAGRSASTPGLVARYRAWQRERPGPAAKQQRLLDETAEAGCAAARDDDAGAFLRAVAAYGRALEEMGDSMGAEIVTAEHRAIRAEAERYGVTYKVSGAGGGDLGLALSADEEALDAFKQSIAARRFAVVDLAVDRHGLLVEERAQ